MRIKYRAASAFTFAQTSAAPPGAEYRAARCDSNGSVPSPIVNQRACILVVFCHLATPCRLPAAKHLIERISLLSSPNIDMPRTRLKKKKKILYFFLSLSLGAHYLLQYDE